MGVALWVGTSIGLAGIAAIVSGTVVVYSTGLWRQWRKRKALYEDAFIWWGMGEKADPIKDFAVKFWSGAIPKEGPPPFIRRTVMEDIEDGLDNERLVLLTGERTSGKSRLIYEVAQKRMTLVTAPVQPNPRDPLAQLMDDHLSLTRSEEPQILFLRDFTKRLVNRDITDSSLRAWLARHPKISVIATVNPDDEKRIVKGGEEVQVSFEEIKKRSKVIELDSELKGQELEDARREFPELDETQLTLLPRYMVLEHPLRERFESEEGTKELTRTIVRAVADWQRTGLARPAPERFLRLISSEGNRRATKEEFEAALRWTIEPVRPAARLIYPVQTGADKEGLYEADRVVLDLLDADKTAQPIPKSTLEAIYEEIIRDVTVGQDEGVAAELLTLGEAALARGRYDFGRDVLKGARNLGNTAQEERSAQALTFGVRIASVTNLLVESRRGDGLLRRIRDAQDLASERRAASPGETADEPSWPIAAIYRRRAVRALVRAVVLMLADVFSASFGLAAGFVVRAIISHHGNVDELLDAFDGLLDAFLKCLVPWGVTTVFLCALVKLYKRDAPRARLGAILLAMGTLGLIGMAAALSEDLNLAAAIPAAIIGTLWASFLDYRLRVKYDSISRGWVKKHTLEAQTLLLGQPEQVAEVEAAIPLGISRPMNVRGYLIPEIRDDPGDADDTRPRPECPHLGSVDHLAKVAAELKIGRVLIADHSMSPPERQALADRCHLRGLLVEAVPSPSDIQAGTAEFVCGQSLVLIPLVPLWRGNTAFMAKRVFDFGIALIAIVLLFPLMAAIALVILAVDGAPFQVRSWRPGVGRQVFGMYRFRTTPERRESPHDPGETGDEEEPPTALGGWLRDRGLDELPQLVNVLLGDMSLVGPRPLRLSADATLHGVQLLRYVVRPGATSPFQVCGRNSVSNSELTDMDMAYLRHWTIVADLEILVKTARLIIRGREKIQPTPEVEST
jgi:lipopolysaccharide/colanic/teichoic acid biosynthesis glycosyltransferase